MVKRPTNRAHLPVRDDAHRKRQLDQNPEETGFLARFTGIKYGCSGKHKRNPYLYDVAPYHGGDNDCSLCDEHADFLKCDVGRIPELLLRSRLAGLAGNLIWTVDDTGWVFELMSTNVGLNEWHGYPLLPNDPFARQVWMRFDNWARQNGQQADREAAERCASLYGFGR